MTKFTSVVFAHEEEGSSGASLVEPTIAPLRQGYEGQATGSPSTPLRTSAINESTGCQTLIQQLNELANRKKLFKLIVVPRPQLDTTIALTAWGAIDKFDEFDSKRIERFIDYYRDHGPEKTME